MWTAYLASRQQRAAEAALVGGGSNATGSGGPLAQLQALARRIRGMQSHISHFLLQQNDGRAPAGVAGSQPSATPRPVPAAALAAATDPAGLWDDDFFRSMQLGVDLRSLERPSALAATHAEGSSTPGGGAGGGALQRLKEAQRVVKAVRVARQARR